MTHRYLDRYTQFSEKRLVFQQAPEVPPEMRRDPVAHITRLFDESLDKGTVDVRLSLLNEVHEQLKTLKKELKVEQREGIRAKLSKERDEQHDNRMDAKLDAMSQELSDEQTPASQERTSAAVTEVSDIAVEDPNVKKGFMDQMKRFLKGGGMAALGPFIKGFIAIKRALLDWFPPKDPAAAKKQLDNIEQLYGRFFGALEVQEVFNRMCRDKGIAMKAVNGTSDGIAYADLKVRYQDKLKTLLEGKNEDQKAALLSAHTFEGFVEEEISNYVDAQKGNCRPGEQYVITLNGIANKQKPKLLTVSA